MATFRTRPSCTYIPPTREEMREAAKVAGLQKFSADLVEDFCNLASGGDIVPPSEYRVHVEHDVDKKLFASERKFDRSEAIGRGMKYQQNICDFLQTVELGKMPGSSPLEQVMNLLKLLAKQEGGGGSGSGEDDPLPIFQEKGEETAKEINQVMDQVNSLTNEETELLDKEDSDEASASDGKDPKQAMKMAEDLCDKARREMLRISRKLDTLSKMRVQRESKFVVDPEGDDVRTRGIKNLGEIARVTKPSWAIYQKSSSLFWLKATTGQLPVRERGIWSEKKQLLYVLIDCSGSMSEDGGIRIAKACGVLMNRLKAVLKGDATLYWRLFDTDLKTEHFVSTPAEAKTAMEELRKGNFSGGSTAIDACSKAALMRIDEIMKEGGAHRPELVVVTDGDNSVGMKLEDLGETRIHAFVVQKTNSALTDLAIKSGGVGIGNL